jgi:hypothetical protein
MSESTKARKSVEGAALTHPQLPFSGLGIQFLSSMRKTLIFERALRKYTSSDILCFIESMVSHHTGASQDVLSNSSFLHYDHDDESSSELDTVLSLVIDKPLWTNGAGDASTCDGEICALLNALLYPSPFRQSSFSESVWNGSVPRACVSAIVCEAVLIDSVSEMNCFSLLAVALESGSEILAHVCLRACLSKFLDAVDKDRDGFVSLSLDNLKFLIQHDGLNLEGNEEDALAAICIWVEHDLVNRLDSFVALFAVGIRFSEIDYYSLAEMVDVCDLVSYHHAATELAAHELIQKTMGLSTGNALGMGTIVGPRRPLSDVRAGQKTHRTRSRVHHTRSLLHRLMHVQVVGDPKAAISQDLLVNVLNSVVSEVEEEEKKARGSTRTENTGLDQEKENTGGGKQWHEHHNDDLEPNMFSRASSTDFMMTSPSHRNFGSAANLPNLMLGASRLATRSILDLANLQSQGTGGASLF